MVSVVPARTRAWQPTMGLSSRLGFPNGSQMVLFLCLFLSFFLVFLVFSRPVPSCKLIMNGIYVCQTRAEAGPGHSNRARHGTFPGSVAVKVLNSKFKLRACRAGSLQSCRCGWHWRSHASLRPPATSSSFVPRQRRSGPQPHVLINWVCSPACLAACSPGSVAIRVSLTPAGMRPIGRPPPVRLCQSIGGVQCFFNVIFLMTGTVCGWWGSNHVLLAQPPPPTSQRNRPRLLTRRPAPLSCHLPTDLTALSSDPVQFPNLEIGRHASAV